MAEGEREGADAHAALALVAAFAKAAREELLGFAPRPPAALPADMLPEEVPDMGLVRLDPCHPVTFGKVRRCFFFRSRSPAPC